MIAPLFFCLSFSCKQLFCIPADEWVMGIYLYAMPFSSFLAPWHVSPAALPSNEGLGVSPNDFRLATTSPSLLGTRLFLKPKLLAARELLRVAEEGVRLYRRCSFDVIVALEKEDQHQLREVVQNSIARSQTLLELMPDYSRERGVLRHIYSSLLQPFVSVQRNFSQVVELAESGWSYSSLQSMVMVFLFNEADRFMEFLDRENGYFVDMTRHQLASQLIDYFYRRTNKQFFKDGLLMLRASAKPVTKEGFIDVGGVQHYAIVNLADVLSWPPDPSHDEALKICLDILGWKLWTRENPDGATIAIDFGPNAILNGYPVNLKVTQGEEEEASRMLGRMTSLALFDDLVLLNQIRSVASGDSPMRGAALLIINRMLQLKPMVSFETFGEFVDKGMEILHNEELHLRMMKRRESDKIVQAHRLHEFMLGPVAAIYALKEEMLRRKPEWRKEAGGEEKWSAWEQRVQELRLTFKK